MPKIQPYIIIPNLMIQPTWGGEYITNLKKITDKKISEQKIGQSYELYESSNLSQKTSTEANPTLEIGNPENPVDTKLVGDDQPINIQTLIDSNPQAILGTKPLKLHGPRMKILNKFTQGLGNSYQIHAKHPIPSHPEASAEGSKEILLRQLADQNDKKYIKNDIQFKWLPKPESWYYLEPGLITLGVKGNWTEYEQTCLKIDSTAQKINQEIKSGKTSLDQGKKELKAFIAKHNPEQFVYKIQVGKYQALDLSPCGIHHSWEEDPKLYPLGNVLYEVQLNVYDDVSTIRSFDKGKIKSDGSIRPLQVADYFKYIDRSTSANSPNNYLRKLTILKKSSLQTIKEIFTTKNYSLQSIKFRGELVNKYTQTQDSFHHLFVTEGNIQLRWNQQTWTVTQGYSIVIPAACGKYKLNTYQCREATVLKTYV